MGELVRTFPWQNTSLGPISRWPQSLRTAVQIILNSRYAMFIWWGGELLNLYNDPYRVFLGVKHPAALGRSAREVWSEIWDEIGPRTDAVLLRGESTFDKALLLMMARHGYIEETYFTFSYSPLPTDDGSIGGIFCAVTEETEGVIDERRLTLLREITAAMAGARTPTEVCQAATRRLQEARRDLPFTLLYLLEGDGTTLTCTGEAGIACGHPAAVRKLSLDDPSAPWPFRQVIETGEPVLVEDLPQRFPDLPHGGWNQPPDCAVLLPIAQQGQKRPAGVLLAGLNPHRRFDEQFRGFVTVLSTQIAGALANANAYEAERRRAEQLAELDLAKTRFFSNVSHEFRTPLTLMLGPLEDLLSEAPERLDAAQRDLIAVVRRNALRLLKLVNTLLDFSRIEAGRVQSVYEPVDLAAFTAELASVFRSLIERAGLTYTVDCPPLPEPVYVDREMWEKIVLNLISNAFKFTLKGSIEVSLRASGREVRLQVRDSGTGIAPGDLPHVFERFYRVSNSRGRSYEGSGIGLALVQELVKLNGGEVSVESELDRGTVFTVSVPFGSAHLPQDRIGATRTSSSSLGADAYLQEASRWGSAATADALPAPGVRPSSEPRTRIVVADDNSDMLDYVQHLLEPNHEVIAVDDGQSALEAVLRDPPDLVLTDIMMPGLDGFELLKAMRSHEQTATIPVIMLSARAGEEALVEGAEAGADDYLVKPFSARQLLACVDNHLTLSRLRRESESRIRQSEERFRALAVASFYSVYRMSPDWSEMRQLTSGNFLVPTESPKPAWLQDYILPEDQPLLLHAIHEAIRTKSMFVLEHRVRRADGSVGWTLSRAIPLLDQNGNITEWFGAASDTTEQKVYQESQARLAAIVDSADDAVISKGLDSIIRTWNQAATRMFGYTAEEAIGRSIRMIIPEELQAEEDHIVTKLRAGERIDHFETVRMKKNGERIDVSLTVSPIRDASGRVTGASKIARDISDRRRMERILIQSEKLSATGRMAATIAHEINNPLESLMNLIYLARENCESQSEAHGYLVTAEQELERVSHLARQTLGYYRDTSAPTEVSLEDLLRNVLTVYNSRLLSTGIAVDVHFHDMQKIVASRGELLQVFSNIIANAIDAMNRGGTLTINTRKIVSSGRDGVEITIRDTGAGIRPEHLSRIFEPFFTTKGEFGTGIGLWFARQLIQSRGGTISVTSSVEPKRSGTAFTIFIPFAMPAQA
ncbi:MAG TPA: ATP-binding protein [Acidobacteriaceae bacterium]|nr:ATP-binding protein [Acidobacteriaceae bacterium]